MRVRQLAQAALGSGDRVAYWDGAGRTFCKFAEGGLHIAGLRREVESGKFAGFRMVATKEPEDAYWQLQGARRDLLTQ